MRSDRSRPNLELCGARSLLFVPGNRPERFAKAMKSGADAIVFDLEDSVPGARKSEARECISSAFDGMMPMRLPLVVRINSLDTPTGVDDIQWLHGMYKKGWVAALMVPKAGSSIVLDGLARRLPGIALLPIIESAAGYAALSDIARVSGVLRLVLGHHDFMADTGICCSADEAELAPLRFAVTMATRLANLSPAIDGVTLNIADDKVLRADTLRAVRFGFGGKLCIHPNQIAAVHASFAPSKEELDWARRVIAAADGAAGAAVQVEGRMIDAPVELQARRVLSRLRAPSPNAC